MRFSAAFGRGRSLNTPGMWSNLTTQNNLQQLREKGVHIFGPAVGLQVCGDVGLGRMLEPTDIINFIKI